MEPEIEELYKKPMINKYKIALSISVVLTIFFVLPWISLAGEARFLQVPMPVGDGRGRILFLTASVFLSNVLLFQYNFFWKRAWVNVKPSWLRGVLHVAANLAIVFILSVVMVRMSARFFNPKMAFFTVYFFRNMGLAAVAMLVTYVYHVIERSRLDRIKLLTLNKEKVETELAALKTQIDPHFLFNSLNSLTGLIRDDPKEAIHFVNHLSDTFRHVLDHRKHNLVPVNEELAFLDSYLYMMKVRFGKGIDITTDVNSSVLDKKLPQFGLQLLVENAVKHNLVSERRPLHIHITAADGVIVVKNNLQVKRHAPRGYGIGLAHLTKHYELLGKEPVRIIQTEKEFQVYLPLL